MFCVSVIISVLKVGSLTVLPCSVIYVHALRQYHVCIISETIVLVRILCQCNYKRLQGRKLTVFPCYVIYVHALRQACNY